MEGLGNYSGIIMIVLLFAVFYFLDRKSVV